MCQSLSNFALSLTKNSYANGQIFERSCVPMVASGRAEHPLIGKRLKPKGKIKKNSVCFSILFSEICKYFENLFFLPFFSPMHIENSTHTPYHTPVLRHSFVKAFKL